MELTASEVRENEELHATYIASKAPDAKSKEEEVDV